MESCAHNIIIILDLAILEVESDNNYKEEHLEDAKHKLEKNCNNKAIKYLRNVVGEVRDVMYQGGDQDLSCNL